MEAKVSVSVNVIFDLSIVKLGCNERSFPVATKIRDTLSTEFLIFKI